MLICSLARLVMFSVNNRKKQISSHHFGYGLSRAARHITAAILRNLTIVILLPVITTFDFHFRRPMPEYSVSTMRSNKEIAVHFDLHTSPRMVAIVCFASQQYACCDGGHNHPIIFPSIKNPTTSFVHTFVTINTMFDHGPSLLFNFAETIKPQQHPSPANRLALIAVLGARRGEFVSKD